MPTIDSVEHVIPREVALHVLFHFGDTNVGLEPGGFVTRLLLTIAKADRSNRELLRLGFPEYVIAFCAVADQPWGLDWLRGIARGSGS